MSAPLVSVIIATWNAGRYLPETLASALGQSWSNLEVIVVDDGSTDDTAEVIRPFLPRIRYERRSHQGLAAARNEGIRLAKGDYVALLDADDLWLPDKISVQVEVAGRHPGTGMVVCNGVYFADDQVLQASLLAAPFTAAIAASGVGEVTGDFHGQLVRAGGIGCPSQVLIPRVVLQEIGPFADFGAQDYDYCLRVSQRYPITVHHHSLARYRYRPDSMSGAREDRDVRIGLYVLPVLLAHRAHCPAEYQDLLQSRIHELVRSLEYGVMKRGRRHGRLEASSQLLTLLRLRPWPPTALLHLAGLWSPELVFRTGSILTRPFRTVG